MNSYSFGVMPEFAKTVDYKSLNINQRINCKDSFSNFPDILRYVNKRAIFTVNDCTGTFRGQRGEYYPTGKTEVYYNYCNRMRSILNNLD